MAKDVQEAVREILAAAAEERVDAGRTVGGARRR